MSRSAAGPEPRIRPAIWHGTIPRDRRTRLNERARDSVARTLRAARTSATGRPISSRCGPNAVNRLAQSPEPSSRSRRFATAARRAIQRRFEMLTTELKSRFTIRTVRRRATCRVKTDRPSAR